MMPDGQRFRIGDQETRTGVSRFLWGHDFKPDVLGLDGKIHRTYIRRRNPWPKGAMGRQIAEAHHGEVLILELDDQGGKIAVWQSEASPVTEPLPDNRTVTSRF